MNSRRFSSLPSGKIVLAVILVLMAFAVAYMATHSNLVVSIIIGLLPLIVLFSIVTVVSINAAYTFFLVVHYFTVFFTRFLEWKGTYIQYGLVCDATLMYVLAIILIHFMSRTTSHKHVRAEPIVFTGIWLVFCLMEGANPISSNEAWFKNIRSLSLYFFAISFIAQMAYLEFKQVKRFVVLWACLSLVTALMTFKQKFFGFSEIDKFFLYAQMAYRTHIIQSGIRYFSIMSDAANLGAAMGVSGTIFAIAFLYEPKMKMKLFYLLTSVLSLIAMLYSGTRSALAVPFVGMALYCLCSSVNKKVVLIAIVGLSAFCFLNFSTVGNTNPVIRRARSALNKEDESYLVRKRNQETLRELLKDKPFGYGIGLSGGSAARFGEDYDEIASIPTDSFYVQIWVQTGYIGLGFYLVLMFCMIGRAVYIVRFKIRDPEIKGYLTAFVCAFTGLFVMSSNNQVYAMFPNGVFAYTSMTLVFLGQYYDKQKREQLALENEKA